MATFKVGDEVVRVRFNNGFRGMYAQIGQRGIVTKVLGDRSSVLVEYTGRSDVSRHVMPEGEHWSITFTELVKSAELEKAKKLLESKGYKVELPKNEQRIPTMFGDIKVKEDFVDFSTPLDGITKETMNLLCDAWQQVQAEKARRASL